MRARLEWLRAETASLEAQLRDTCEPWTRGEILPLETAAVLGLGDDSPSALTVPASDGASTTGLKRLFAPRSQPPESRTASTDKTFTRTRRRERDLPSTYSIQCYRPASSFTDASCGCLGKPKSSEFDLRPTIKIVAGSWYVPPDVN